MVWESGYKDEHPKLVIEMMREGKPMVAVCAAIGISKPTFYEWLANYPAFRSAYKFGKSLSEAYWWDKAENALHEKDFNFNGLKFIMANRFGTGNTRKVRADWLETKDLIGSFKRLATAHDEGDVSLEELQVGAKVLLDLASIKEREELEKRLEALEAALALNNES